MSARGVNLLRIIRVPVLLLLVTLISHPVLAQVDVSGMWRPFPGNQAAAAPRGSAESNR